MRCGRKQSTGVELRRWSLSTSSASCLPLPSATAFQTGELKAGRWTLKQNVTLSGKTLGVVGTGNVGREVARVANLLGMRCLAWTYNPSPERARELGVEFVELDELLGESDVVSLHVRLSDESRHLIGAREFGLMKPGALFINAGRGGLVDTAALVDALQSEHLAGAALDVFDQEPLAIRSPDPRLRTGGPHAAPCRPDPGRHRTAERRRGLERHCLLGRASAEHRHVEEDFELTMRLSYGIKFPLAGLDGRNTGTERPARLVHMSFRTERSAESNLESLTFMFQ